MIDNRKIRRKGSDPQGLTPFFFGWDYIGRIRQNTLCREIHDMDWLPAKSLYKTARQKAKYLGNYLLAKENPLNMHLYIYKEPKKHRVKINLAGKKVQCSASLKHEKRETEPLLLATSLSNELYYLMNPSLSIFLND